MAALQGMKMITDHVNRSEATVLKLITEEGLPAVKLGGIWESTTELIDKWRELKIRGAGLDELEALVDGLQQKRTTEKKKSRQTVKS